jgi:hypothetical protein
MRKGHNLSGATALSDSVRVTSNSEAIAIVPDKSGFRLNSPGRRLQARQVTAPVLRQLREATCREAEFGEVTRKAFLIPKS